jgi:hypothetical protein
VKWDQTNSDPLADLEAARLAVIRDSGISPNVVLFGTTAKSAFLNNAAVAKFLDSIRFQIATIKPRIVDDAVVYFGGQAGLEYYSYAEYFEDDAGTLYPMLPPELVLLASTNVPNKIVYGAYTQLEDARAKRYVTYQTSRIPFVYGEEDDGMLFYRLTSCPLPMPVDVLGWRVIEAITGATYPFPSPQMAHFDPTDPEAQPQGKEGVDFFRAPVKPENVKGKKADSGDTLAEPMNDDLETHTVDQLKSIAAEEGVDLSGIHRKDEIIDAIHEHRRNS